MSYEYAREILANGIDRNWLPSGEAWRWWDGVPIPSKWTKRNREGMSKGEVYQFMVESIFPEEFP